MAEKSIKNGKSASKNKVFNKGSKMRRYEQIFDEDLQQMRCGFFNKNLYKQGKSIKQDDTIWAIEAGYEYRSDLISTKFYGTSKYDWVIEELNDIKDPIRDLVIGRKLKLPSQSKILTLG
jgi:hypothetical protein